ncbi:MAG: bacillithiol biosynthesis cysteine-adding enzyme BshC [Paenibacillaceae bacterium]|nr:MAG: bacillithiol biosynthesis cysteine-adding enzyme BshC [Paenibacillaceae bacterium]
MHVHCLTNSISSPVSEAYVRGTDPELAALFGGHAGDPEAWRRRAERLERHRHDRADATRVAEALAAYNRRIGASGRALANIDRLAAGALAVVGGQQAGLFTGPVLVIYKALSIIHAARWAEEKTGRPVVPVFWIAGEDHDWQEANHAYIVSRETGLVRIAVEREEHPRTSVSRTKLGRERIEGAIRSLAASLPDSEFKPALLDRIEASAARAETLSDWFGALMADLFAEDGLILMDADDPAIRAVEAPMFRRMVAENDGLASAFASAEEKLKRLGYAVQAELQPSGANLFLFRDERFGGIGPGAPAGERVMLYRDGENFIDKRRTFALGRGELERLALEAPYLFSNNVLTRPLMQDYVLPVLATVLGQGEIAYWAQVGDAFRAFGMEMPIIVPRMSFTVTDGAIRKRMEMFGLTMDDVSERLEERKRAWLAAHDSLPVERLFAEAARRFDALYDPLIAELAAADSGLGPLGQKNKEKIREQIRWLEQKALESRNRRYEADIRRFDRIGDWLAPGGRQQERVLNMAAMWNAWGGGWLEALRAVPFHPLGGHYRIDL